MAASTASMCLRKESLSVHSHMRFQASSRFMVSPFGRKASGFRFRLTFRFEVDGTRTVRRDKGSGTDERLVNSGKLKPEA